MKRIEIHHVTRYAFPVSVQLGPHTLLLRPREGHDLHILSATLEVSPEATLTWRRDCYDNVIAVAVFAGTPVSELLITSQAEVELYETMPLNFVVEEHALYFPLRYTAEEQAALQPFLEPLYQEHPVFSGWLEPFRLAHGGEQTFTVLDRLNQRIHADIAYEVRHQPGVLAPVDLLQRASGSCRDLALLFLESCRRLGIAARFVSGYVHGPATEAGGASSHAWAEVYLPGAGWKGFDPTHAAVVGPDHIAVAVHRHPQAIPPVAGVFIGPDGMVPELSVDVRISGQAT